MIFTRRDIGNYSLTDDSNLQDSADAHMPTSRCSIVLVLLPYLILPNVAGVGYLGMMAVINM